ncbi:degenerin-like protein del-10 [Tubulanus polymorphus]|uniref:degenerin-like protein del-10 n=1 Tax=Tubulanus polymorphus TaxID=672921 RepID=UPI003DA480F0
MTKADSKMAAVKTEDKQTFKEALSDFSNDTAFHGVRYIGHSPTITIRCIWLMLFFGMTGALIYQVHDRVKYYISRPVTVDISLDNNRGQIPFPAVTICNTNTFRLSDVYNDGLFKSIDRFYRQNVRPITPKTENISTNTNLSTTENISITGNYSTEDALKNVDMRSLILKYGHRLNDTVKSANFQSEALTMANLTTMLTDYGQCFGFNHDKKKHLYSQGTGAAYGLNLLINLEQYQDMEGDHKSAGLKVLVHDKHQGIRMKDLSLSVPPSMSALIDVQAKKTTELQDPYGNCMKYAQRQSMCEHNCYIRVTSSICKCLPFYAEDSTAGLPYCTLEQHRYCYQLELARMRRNQTVCGTRECPPPCQQLTYDSRISYAALSKSMARKMAQKEKNNLNMLADYKMAREALYNADPRLANASFSTVFNFVSSLEKSEMVIKNVSDFLEDQDKIIYSDKLYVAKKLREMSISVRAEKVNYLRYTELEKISTIVIPGLTSRIDLSDLYLKYVTILYENSISAPMKYGAAKRILFPTPINIVTLSDDIEVINANVTRRLKTMIAQKQISMVDLNSLMFDNKELLEKFPLDLQTFMDNSLKVISSVVKDMDRRSQPARDFIGKMLSYMIPADARTSLAKMKKKLQYIVEENNELTETMKKYLEAQTELTLANSLLNNHVTKNNYVYVSVYFQTLSLETLKKSEGYLWFSLVCDIGGSAGLYLGGSLLAIAEVVWFFGSQLVYLLKRLRRKRTDKQDEQDGVTETKNGCEANRFGRNENHINAITSPI